jgi:hypothetical protein
MVPRTSYALEVRRHVQYMNGRHTRDKRVRSAHPTRVTRVCHILPEQHPAHIHADDVHMMRASYARHSSSKCDVNAPEARITRVAPGVRSALLSMGYFCSGLQVHLI